MAAEKAATEAETATTAAIKLDRGRCGGGHGWLKADHGNRPRKPLAMPPLRAPPEYGPKVP